MMTQLTRDVSNEQLKQGLESNACNTNYTNDDQQKRQLLSLINDCTKSGCLQSA